MPNCQVAGGALARFVLFPKLVERFLLLHRSLGALIHNVTRRIFLRLAVILLDLSLNRFHADTTVQ